jgi:pimeloyl-ACP methyl ester carboxylesterase
MVPEWLRAAGFAVLAFDFRGHGQSDGAPDPPKASDDLRTALAFLASQAQVDGERIALVGASMGGMASVIVGAEEPGVRTVVAISTSPGAGGQYPDQVVDQISPRPFLAVGCDGDPITLPARVRQLYDLAGSPKEIVILGCNAHANDILESEAAQELLDLLLQWLKQHVHALP